MPSQKTIRLVRRVLLIVLLGFAGVIALLLWFGQRRPQDPLLVSDRTTQPGDLDVDVSTGFDYTISVGDRNLMRVRADRVVSRAGREVRLEQIGPIELYRNDGQTVFIRADSGTIDIETGSASLAGNVEMQGPGGTAFWTQRLDLPAEGKVVRSEGKIRLSKGEELVGTANRLAADLDTDEIRLIGRVQFTVRGAEGAPDYKLNGRRAIYFSDRREAQFAGGVVLTNGSAKLSAREMTALSAEDGRIDTVRFRRRVKGDWLEQQPGSEAMRLQMRAEDLYLDFGPEGELAESRLRGIRPVRLTATQGQIKQALRGINIDLRWNGGQPASGSVRTQAQVIESTPEGKRSAASDVMEFAFSGGMLSTASMRDDVRVREGDATTVGNRATYSASSSDFAVTGSPATTTFPTGTLTSPKINYNANTRSATAVAPVRGEFRRGAEPGVISGETPSKFEATEAKWNQASSVVTLSGNARVWQGRDLLVADRILANLEQRHVTAEGDVRVILEQQAETPDGAPVRVEAASDRMTYQESERIIRMTGNSTAQRDGRTLSCADLDVVLNVGGEAEQMFCTGGVRLLDSAAGRTVSGEMAVYQIVDREVVFTGDPVLVESDDGSTVSGLRLRYRLDDGEAIMDVGNQPADTTQTLIIEPDPVKPESERAGAVEPGTAAEPQELGSTQGLDAKSGDDEDETDE